MPSSHVDPRLLVAIAALIAAADAGRWSVRDEAGVSALLIEAGLTQSEAVGMGYAAHYSTRHRLNKRAQAARQRARDGAA